MTTPMEPTLVDGNALMLAGHDYPSHVAAIGAAEQWLTDKGLSTWDLDDARPHLRPIRAWWGGDDVGFVQATYPGAVPVTVVSGIPTTK